MKKTISDFASKLEQLLKIDSISQTKKIAVNNPRINDLALNLERLPKIWISSIFMLSITLIFMIKSNNINCSIIVFGTPYNILSMLIYYYWIAAILFGFKKVPQGHKGLLLLNGEPIIKKGPFDTTVFTFPVFPKIVELWCIEAEIAVSVMLDGSSEPKIITASQSNATYDIKEEEKFKGNKLHNSRKFIRENEIIVIFDLGDEVAFYKSKRSVEEVRERLKQMVQAMRLQTFGKKTMAQDIGSLEVVEERIKKVMENQLENYDNCLSVKNVLLTKIGYELIPEGVKQN